MVRTVNPIVQYGHLTLYPKKFSFDQFIRDHELVAINDPDVIVTNTLEGMLIKVNNYIMTERLEPQHIAETKTALFRVPDTWWDHFKCQYYNKWWMPFKKYKIRVEKQKVLFDVTVTPLIYFPEFKTPRYPDRMGKWLRGIEVYTEVIAEWENG